MVSTIFQMFTFSFRRPENKIASSSRKWLLMSDAILYGWNRPLN